MGRTWYVGGANGGDRPRGRPQGALTCAPVVVGRVLVVATVCLLLLQGARAWGSAADRNRRAHEIAAREPELYRQLAERDALLESQRRIYIERFRKLEGQVRDREQDVAALRALLSVAIGVVP